MSEISGDVTEVLKRNLGLRGSYRPQLVDVIQPIVDVGPRAGPAGIPWSTVITSAAVAANRSIISVDTLQTGRYRMRVDKVRIISQGAANTQLLCGFGIDSLIAGVTVSLILDSSKWTPPSGGTGTPAPLGNIRAGQATAANMATRGTAFWELDTDGSEWTGQIWLEAPVIGVATVGPFFALMQDTDNVALRAAISGYAFSAL